MKKRLMAVLLCICMALSSFAGTGITVSATEETSIVNDDDLTETSDAKLAAAVDSLIEAIGTVSLESADEIKVARDAYDVLTEEQKVLVTKLETLTEAETAYAVLQNEALNAELAATVDGLIEAIGTVSLESADEIKAARDAYDALTEEQKALVTKLETLTEAETAYAVLQNEALNVELAATVDGLIEAIGTVSLESADAIKAARDTYDALTEEQKVLVTKLDTLKAAEETYQKIQNDDKNTVTSGNSMEYSVNPITTETQSGVYHLYLSSEGVTKSGTWEESGLKDSTGNNNSIYGTEVGDYVEYKPTSMEAGWYSVSFWNIAKQQNPMKMTATIVSDGKTTEKTPDTVQTDGWTNLGTYYFAGTGEEYLKMSITSSGQFSRLADAKFEKVQNDDIEAAAAVDELIEAIGTVTKDSGDAIEAARTAYDALSDDQKVYVRKFEILTTAEAAYKELKPVVYYLDQEVNTTGVTRSQNPIGWKWSGAKGYNTNSRFVYSENNGANVEYKPASMEAGWYTVSFWNNAGATKMTMTASIYADGKTTTVVPEKISEHNAWTELGTYYFVGAGDEYLKITVTDTSERSYLADAKFEKVQNDDIKAAAAVDKLIEAIGTVTKDSGDAIEAARSAYDALTENQKVYVRKAAVLEAAETAYEALELKVEITSVGENDGIVNVTGTVQNLGSRKVEVIVNGDLNLRYVAENASDGTWSCTFKLPYNGNYEIEASVRDYSDFSKIRQTTPDENYFILEDTQVWGATVTKHTDGLYYMIFSTWETHNKFSYDWPVYSELGYAVSTKLEGPYIYQGKTLDASYSNTTNANPVTWEGVGKLEVFHNPTIMHSEKDGKYYLYFMGTNASEGGYSYSYSRNHQRIGVAYADSPAGPWTVKEEPVIDVREGMFDNLLVSNPSVTEVKQADGTYKYYTVYKSVEKSNNKETVASGCGWSDSPLGPFTRSNEAIMKMPGVSFSVEDCYLWHSNGKFYALAKDMHNSFTEDTTSRYNYALFESNDCEAWEISENELAYQANVPWVSGTTEKYYLERAQLYLEDEIPFMICCASSVGYGDFDTHQGYNIQIPLLGVLMAKDTESLKITGLEEKTVNKNELSQLLQKATEAQESCYTSGTWIALQSARRAAEIISNRESAEQKDVDFVANQLETLLAQELDPSLIPYNIALGKKVEASNTYTKTAAGEDVGDTYSASKAVDGSTDTRWATSVKTGDNAEDITYVIDLDGWYQIDNFEIKQYYNDRIQSYEWYYLDGTEWKTCFSGTASTLNIKETFSEKAVTEKLKLCIKKDYTQAPTIWEIEVYGLAVSDIIYENDFENGGKLSEFNNKTGIWNVADGKLNCSTDNSSLLIKYLDSLPENYEVSADITQTGAKNDSALGIVFGATDDKNFYHLRVCIGADEGGNVKQVQLLKWSDNKATKLIIESPYQWYTEENNKTCTLTAKVVGDKIICYVNDQELFSYTLQEGDPLLGTGVGYRVYKTAMNSDKIVVTRISAQQTGVELPESSIIVDNEDKEYTEIGTFKDADNQIKGRDDSVVRLAEESSAKARWGTYANETGNYTVYYWNPVAQSESCNFFINTMDGMWKKTLGASELSSVGWVKVATISGTETTVMSAELSGVNNKVYADAVAFAPTSDKADEQYNSTGGGSSEVAVLVNQIGYDSGTSMRATVPNANDGTKFQVVNAATGNAVYEGEIKNNIADFTGQISCTDDTDYYITCAGARSYNFTIGENLIYRRSVENALKFMAETRHDEFKWGLYDDKYSIGWRDGHQFSFELNGLVLQYMANPSLYDNMDYQIYEVGKCEYEELRTQDEPAIIWLMQFAALRYYDRGQECKLHALTKEQLAYFLYIYPQISEYVSKDTYEKIRDYTIDVWGDSECTSEGNGSAFSISGTNHDLYSLQTVFGGLKGSQPPGHSIVPNLLMYEVALRDDLGTDVADKFFKAAYDNCEYLIGDEIDIKDPFYNKGQRMSEYITIPALSYFLEMYPDKAPEGLKEEIQSWAEVTIKRADNMWDTRMAASMEAGDSQYYFHHPGLADTKLSEDYWTGAAYAAADKQTDKTVYPGGAPKNEPGNQAGLQAITYAAARVLDDSNTVDRLQAIGVAAIDDLFGRNPSGRAAFYHFTRDFIGADLGWYTQHSGGVGLLGGHTAVIDANAPEGCYPYNPESYNTGYTEGWVAYNTAWNASIAYAAANAVDLQVSKSSASKGENITITLTAPMNMDSSKAESGEVIVTTSTGEKTVVIVTEDGTNSSVFKGSYTLPDVPYITISYGSGLFENSCEVTVEDFNGVSVTSIHLEDEQLTLGVGEKIRLNAVVLPSNASDQRVSYSTSNANVASVTSDGQVKAIGVGEAVITVSSVSNPNLTDTCKVTVKAAVPAGLQLKASDTLNAMSDGDEKLAISGVIYSDGSIKTDNLPDTVEFATDNKKVLVVKADGTMVPVGVGTATVTATATVDGKKISGEAEIQVTATATYNLLQLYRDQKCATSGTSKAEEGKNTADGEFLKLYGNAAGNEISFNLGNIDAGKYQITLYTKFGSAEYPYGVWTLKMDGKILKKEINFTDNGSWKNVDLGEVMLTDGNNHTFTFVSEDGKTLVPGSVTLTRIGGENPDLKAAEAVDKLIEAIGTVTKDSGDAIKAARTAYDNLTDVQKLMVEKLDVLTMAEEAYQKLQAGTSKPGTGGESDKEASSISDKKDSASKDKEDSGTTYVETVYANNTNTGDSAPIIGILLLMSLAIVGIIMIAKRKASKE